MGCNMKKTILLLCVFLFAMPALLLARTSLFLRIATGGPTINLTKDADADVLIDFNLSLPAGYEVVIDWGDGNSDTVTGPVTSTSYTNTYADTNEYSITISGDIDQLTRIYLLNEPISADLDQFLPALSLEYLTLYWCGFTGDSAILSNLTSLTYININSNLISGNAAGAIALGSMGFLDLSGNSVTYTTTTLPNRDDSNIFLQSNGWTETMVDAFLCDLDAASTSSTKTVNVGGSNAAPSSTGQTCATSLTGKGWTVTYTAP